MPGPLAGKYGLNLNLDQADYTNPISPAVNSYDPLIRPLTQNPYAEQERALEGIKDPDLQGFLRYGLAQQKYLYDPQRMREELQAYSDVRKKEAWDAFGMKQLASIPQTIANTVYNRDALGILAEIPRNISPILQGGIQSANLRDRFKYFS
jgi:hypothetical protein